MKYHYVYRITNIEENKHYYGVRTSHIPPIEDLGIKYFSSSSNQAFINEQKLHKDNFKYKVIKLYSTREEALTLEIKLHNKFNVSINESFYNKIKQTSTGWSNEGNKEIAKKIGDAHRGKITSEDTKRKISLAKTGVKLGKQAEEHIRKRTIQITGEGNGMYGKSHTEETKLKMSQPGSKNKNAKIIHIYNEKGETMFTCHGNFKCICKNNQLPTNALAVSYRNNGEPLYTHGRVHSPKHKGWYAKVQ